MKSFLRENPTIAFGLGLPLLLVVVFLLASGIPTLLVGPPKHDVLFATGYYHQQQAAQMLVTGQKLEVSYHGVGKGEHLPRLWRYEAKTGAVREIAILWPPGLESRSATPAEVSGQLVSTPIDVPDIAGLVVDSSSISPDGYTFSAGSDRYSRNVFRGLFNASRYRHQATLTKKGRRIRLPNTDVPYYRQHTRFIGWVIAP